MYRTPHPALCGVKTIRDERRASLAELVHDALASANVEDLTARHEHVKRVLVKLTLVDVDPFI